MGRKDGNRKTEMFPRYGIYHEIMSVVTLSILFWNCFVFWYYNHSVAAIEVYSFIILN